MEVSAHTGPFAHFVFFLLSAKSVKLYSRWHPMTLVAMISDDVIAVRGPNVKTWVVTFVIYFVTMSRKLGYISPNICPILTNQSVSETREQVLNVC